MATRLEALVLMLTLAGCTSGDGGDLYRKHLMPAASGADGRVSVTWLGTAGVYVTDGEAGFLVDPFVSRARLLDVVLGEPLPRQRELVEATVAAHRVPKGSPVLVMHTHYDHALDAPLFAEALESPLIGSSSAAFLKDGVRVVKGGETIEHGRFRIKIVKGCHEPLVLGYRTYPGAIEAPVPQASPASAYRVGDVFALVVEHPRGRFVHQGSPCFVEGMYAGERADVALLGIASRSGTKELVDEITTRLGVTRLLPIHFDDFFRPVGEELRPILTVDLAEFFGTLAAERPGVRVETLPIGEPRGLY